MQPPGWGRRALRVPAWGNDREASGGRARPAALVAIGRTRACSTNRVQRGQQTLRAGPARRRPLVVSPHGDALPFRGRLLRLLALHVALRVVEEHLPDADR